MRSQISRRQLLQLLGAGTAGAALTACVPAAPAGAPAAADEAAAEPMGFDWQRYAGTELRYVGETQPLSDHVLSILPKFEEMTGIKVNTEILPWAQMVQKIRVELMASNEDMDVFQLPAGAEERNVWFDAGWLNDIGPWVDDPSMTHEDYDLWEDMGRDYLMAGYSSRGSLVSVPMQMSAMIGYYRKDLFEEYGIDGPPTTFEELEAAAATVQEQSGGEVFGITMRGKPPVPTSVFKGFLGGMGIMWEDDEGIPLMDSDEAIAAFDFYGKLLRLYGPPGSPNIDHVGAVNIFSQGKAGMIIDDAVFRKDFQDPSKSTVAGNIGYFLMPAGPNGQRASAGGWSITVGGLSQKKEASWYLLQFISNKESMLKYVLDGGAVPRRSPYETEAYKTQATQDDLDFVQVLLDSRAIGDFSPPAPPSIINLMRARESIAQVIVTSIEGGDVVAAAQKSQQELLEMLEEQEE